VTSLDIQGLELHFGGLVVLDHVDLHVSDGELVALVGPNGAGKTSLLNCVSGLYGPSGGHIRFRGRDLAGLPAHKVAAAGIGRVFQHVELFPQLSVVHNVLVGRHRYFRTHPILDGLYWGPARRAEHAQRAAIEPVLRLLGLEGVRDTLASALPYGLQKLVGLARALALEPGLLLLDEPSAGLHRQDKELFARVVARIRQELGTSMLWVEHDMELVADLADRVAVLNFGQLIAAGAPHVVLRDARVVHSYLGRSDSGAAEAFD
jgi:branched-chain amino acid transport system ATP-binding protein